MKKSSVVLFIVVFALIIAAAACILPIAMVSNSVKISKNIEIDEYNAAYREIAENNYISEDLKSDAVLMKTVANDTVRGILKSEMSVVLYLSAIIALVLILVGVYFIKNEGSKNYVGTAFIAAGCIILAVIAIFMFYVFKM